MFGLLLVVSGVWVFWKALVAMFSAGWLGLWFGFGFYLLSVGDGYLALCFFSLNV